MGKFSQCDLMAFWTIIYSINFSTLYLFHKKSETKNKNVLILLHTWPKIHSYKPHYTTFYKGIQLLKTFLKLANCTFYHLQNVNRSQNEKNTHKTWTSKKILYSKNIHPQVSQNYSHREYFSAKTVWNILKACE